MLGLVAGNLVTLVHITIIIIICMPSVIAGRQPVPQEFTAYDRSESKIKFPLLAKRGEPSLKTAAMDSGWGGESRY